MRHLFIAFVLLLLTNPVVAQEQVDSTYLYSWIDEAWSVNREIKQTYPAPNLVIRNQTRVDEDGIKTPLYYFEYYYDDQGNDLGYERSNWDAPTEEWVKSGKVIHTYDNLNRRTTRLAFTYNLEDEAFEQYERVEYNAYNEFNAITKYHKYEINDTTGNWYLVYGLNYERYYEDMLADSVALYQYYGLDADTTFLYSRKYYHNADGLIESEHQYGLNENQELSRVYVKDYLHEEGLLSKETRYSDNGLQLSLFDELTYGYTAQENLNDRIKGHYEGTDFVHDWRITHTYLEPISAVDNALKDVDLTWSNPQMGVLNLQLEMDDNPRDLTLTLYTLNGQIVKHKSFHQINTWNQSYFLSPGFYVVNIRDRSGKYQVRKVVVH